MAKRSDYRPSLAHARLHSQTQSHITFQFSPLLPPPFSLALVLGVSPGSNSFPRHAGEQREQLVSFGMSQRYASEALILVV